jgi:hypothetical protein
MKKESFPRCLRNIIAIVFMMAISLSAHSSDSTIFRDDFERAELGRWWQAAPSWSIVNGSAYSYIDGIGGTLRTSKEYDSATYIVETKASGFTVNYMREFRITFGQSNISKDSMYVLSYKPFSGGKLTLSLSTDNIYFPKSLDEAIVYPNLDAEHWYTFKIAHYKSGLIQIYIDKGEGYSNTPFLETIDSTYSKAGHVGWQLDTQTFPESFYVDWIRAYKPSLEKPAVHEKPDEDDLITQVSAKSGLEYKVAKLDSGINQYTDRNYIITSVPPYLDSASFIRTAMNDKKNITDSFLTFFVKKTAIIYIGYDPRATVIPAWLSSWTKTRDRITTSDSLCPYLDLYSRLTEAGEVYPYPVSLGGNLAGAASGAEANYIVAALPRPELLPLQAEDAYLSGAIVSKDNIGFVGTGYADYRNSTGDYIEWTVKIDVPGTYNTGFTYANGGIGDRPLKINYDESDFGILQFSSTLSWNTWSFLNANSVYLTRGTHKIRATAIGFSGPNIDQLSLSYISPAALPATIRKDIQRPVIVSSLPDPSQKAYPNPFYKSTTINYTVKEKSKVVLSIYTLQGQQVRMLVNETVEPGIHQATFSANELPAGIYVYRLKIGNEIKVGKLVKE